MDTVRKGNGATVQIKMYGRDGSLEAPGSAVYRIDDLESGSSIRQETALAAGHTVLLDLDATDTDIVTSGERQEIHRITVTATYGQGDVLVDEYDFKVKDTPFA
jgi:microcystin degradation protein MlrC